MLGTILTLATVAAFVLAFGSHEPARPSLADQRAYEAAKAEAGNNPAKLVKLAVWCEVHGLRAEQRAVLDQAVRLDPNNVAARGMLGQVSYQHRWETPEAVQKQMHDDEALMARLAEYNARRDHIESDTEIERRAIAQFEQLGLAAKAGEVKLRLDRRIAPEHVRLGLWCEQNGLKPEALAHFTTALHLDPHHDATWRHLGYIKHHGRWMSHEQIAAEQHEALLQKHADRHWGPLLQKWCDELGVPRRRAAAQANLAQITDPRAVPAIVRRLWNSPPAGQMLAVDLLRQIDAPAASRRLGALALYSEDAQVRQAAAEALKGRAPRDYAGELVDLIHATMTYQVRPVGGPGTQGALVIDSPRFRITRTYTAPAPFRLASNFRGYVGYDPNGLPVVMSGNDLRNYQDESEGGLNYGKSSRGHFLAAERILRDAEARTAELLAAARVDALIARERLAADVRDLEEANAQGTVLNQRIRDVLRVSLDARERPVECIFKARRAFPMIT